MRSRWQIFNLFASAVAAGMISGGTVLGAEWIKGEPFTYRAMLFFAIAFLANFAKDVGSHLSKSWNDVEEKTADQTKITVTDEKKIETRTSEVAAVGSAAEQPR